MAASEEALKRFYLSHLFIKVEVCWTGKIYRVWLNSTMFCCISVWNIENRQYNKSSFCCERYTSNSVPAHSPRRYSPYWSPRLLNLGALYRQWLVQLKKLRRLSRSFLLWFWLCLWTVNISDFWSLRYLLARFLAKAKRIVVANATFECLKASQHVISSESNIVILFSLPQQDAHFLLGLGLLRAFPSFFHE